MQKYKCKIAPTDVLSVYVTDMEPYVGDLLALVATNVDGKVSVLLTKEDAANLRDQIINFIKTK